MSEGCSKYPAYIKSLAELSAILDEDGKLIVAICVLGLGRSPKMAHDLTLARFKAFSLRGGLGGVAKVGDLREAVSLLARPWLVVATINEVEQDEYGKIIRKINRARVRNVVVSESFEEVLHRLRQTTGE